MIRCIFCPTISIKQLSMEGHSEFECGLRQFNWCFTYPGISTHNHGQRSTNSKIVNICAVTKQQQYPQASPRIDKKSKMANRENTANLSRASATAELIRRWRHQLIEWEDMRRQEDASRFHGANHAKTRRKVWHLLIGRFSMVEVTSEARDWSCISAIGLHPKMTSEYIKQTAARWLQL
jgi:hypothetical protein